MAVDYLPLVELHLLDLVVVEVILSFLDPLLDLLKEMLAAKEIKVDIRVLVVAAAVLVLLVGLDRIVLLLLVRVVQVYNSPLHIIPDL